MRRAHPLWKLLCIVAAVLFALAGLSALGVVAIDAAWEALVAFGLCAWAASNLA